MKDKKGFDFGNKGKFNFNKKNDYSPKPEKDYSPHNIAARKTEGTIKQQKARRNKVDPDAPGTPGTPGHEPPVKRSDLDEKGKKLWDKLREPKNMPKIKRKGNAR